LHTQQLAALKALSYGQHDNRQVYRITCLFRRSSLPG
jgi:hypothetical protein